MQPSATADPKLTVDGVAFAGEWTRIAGTLEFELAGEQFAVKVDDGMTPDELYERMLAAVKASSQPNENATE